MNGPPERYRLDGVPWVLDPAIGGGGALRNLGIHGIDAALALAGGADLAIVSAAIDRRLHGEAVEEYAVVTLRAPDGMIATVEAGYTYASMAPGGDFEWRVSARNAYLIDRGDACRVATLDDGQVREPGADPAGGPVQRLHGRHAGPPGARRAAAGRDRRLSAGHAPDRPGLRGGRT